MSYANTTNPNAPVSLVETWDKTFAKSTKVNHRKVTFQNRFGITWSVISTFKGSRRAQTGGHCHQRAFRRGERAVQRSVCADVG